MFLLSLLPDLESLAPQWYRIPNSAWPDDIGVPDEEKHKIPLLLQSLISRANDVKLTDQPLSRLRVLQPTCLEGTIRIILHALFPLLSLRSLREVCYLGGVLFKAPPHAMNYVELFTLYRPLGPNIEILELYDCEIEERWSQLLFENMKNLRELKLGYQIQDEDPWIQYTCRTLLDAVAPGCG